MVDSSLPRDPNHAVWTQPEPSTLPPDEAYRYFPLGGDLRNKGQRFVYGGNTVFEPEEEEKYATLETYMQKNSDRLQVIPEK